MDIENCDPLNLFVRMDTGEIECLPGVLIPPAGYTQMIPEVNVSPRRSLGPWIVAAFVLYSVVK